MKCNATERAFLQPTLSSICQTDFENPPVAYADLSCYRALTEFQVVLSYNADMRCDRALGAKKRMLVLVYVP